MLRVYEKQCEKYVGCARRTLDYWKQKLVNPVFSHTFFFSERGRGAEIVIAKRGGKVLGYCYTFNALRSSRVAHVARDWGLIHELLALDHKTLRLLAKHAIRLLLDEGVKTISVTVPNHSPYSEIFKNFVLIREREECT